MNEERANDPNRLIEFIASAVEALRLEMGGVRVEMGGMRAQMDSMRVQMDTMRAEMATKDQMNAGFAAVRADIERLALRLDQVDRSHSLRTAAVETEVSRIRSVVYVLAKDQPDLVRMLGS